MDCGPACLKMISSFYSQEYSIEILRDLCCIAKDGVSLKGISLAAEIIGFKTIGGRLTIDKLMEKACYLPFFIGIRNTLWSYTGLRKRKKTSFFILPIPAKDFYNTIKKIF